MKYNRAFRSGILAFVIGTACCWIPAVIFLFGGASLANGIGKGLNQVSLPFIFLGMGLVGYSYYSFRKKSQIQSLKPSQLILHSSITCPECRNKTKNKMPTDACQYFYECKDCKSMLKPKSGDCCVYCSYGSVPCPPIQQGQNCC